MSSPASEPSAFPERSAVLRAAIGIGVYAGAFGATFGAVSAGAGLQLGQTMLLSLVMFSGAAQFAFVGVAAGGAAGTAAGASVAVCLAALSAAVLLGVRNAFYGVPVSEILRPRGVRRLLTAHFVIDETTAMAVGQSSRAAQRFAFWSTGLILCAMWNLGTLVGALLGRAIDPADFGLDAAGPAVFLALLWPRLKQHRAWIVALAGAAVALLLLPVAPKGLPVIASAAVAVVAGLLPARRPDADANPADAGPGEDPDSADRAAVESDRRDGGVR